MGTILTTVESGDGDMGARYTLFLLSHLKMFPTKVLKAETTVKEEAAAARPVLRRQMTSSFPEPSRPCRREREPRKHHGEVASSRRRGRRIAPSPPAWSEASQADLGEDKPESLQRPCRSLTTCSPLQVERQLGSDAIF